MPLAREIPLLAFTSEYLSKFWGRVDRRSEDECWEWTGARRRGYGLFQVGVCGNFQAHRVSFAIVNGQPDPNLTIDHLCNNPPCVNPAHLELVTHQENMRRQGVRQTHCANGHEYDEKNTYIRPQGRRDCRTCRDARRAAYQERERIKCVSSRKRELELFAAEDAHFEDDFSHEVRSSAPPPQEGWWSK